MIQNTHTSHLEAPWLVIVNLHSGGGTTANVWPKLRKKLALLLPQAEFRESEYVGAASDLLQAAVATGVRHVMAVGGDGTAHQVVNAIMQQTLVASTEITFTLLPCGTGNDWIKTHGISTKWEAWKVRFIAGKICTQNLGHIDYMIDGQPAQRYFMNVAGLAYDAYVVRAMQGQRTSLPPRLFYYWSGLRSLFQFRPPAGQLHFNEQEIHDEFYTINLGICRYSGGGMQFVPHADPIGSTLALTYVRKSSKLSVLFNSHRFYGGRIAGYFKSVLKQTTRIEITPDAGQEILIEADGELLGVCPVRVEVALGRLRFI